MTNYNLTNLSTVNGLGDIIVQANYFTDGHFVGLMLIALFVIIFMALKKDEMLNALIASSWVTFILSLLLTFGNLLNPYYTLFFGIMAGLFVALHIYAGQN
jgi:asparagine N-glycosylation enzyme membrane subunit Stt3